MYGAASSRHGADGGRKDERSDSPPVGFKGTKRRQVKKACAHCRKGHRCCEEQRPCKRCRRKGLACDDGEPQKPRFKLYNTEAQNVAQQQARMMQEPSALQQQQQQHQMQNPYMTPMTPDLLALQLMLAQQAQQHAQQQAIHVLQQIPGRYMPIEQDMSLTDTVSMQCKPAPSSYLPSAIPMDARSSYPLVAMAAGAYASQAPVQWPAAAATAATAVVHPPVAIPTPVALSASTELHQSLVQSINNLRSSVPDAVTTSSAGLSVRRASDTAFLRAPTPSQEPPPGVTVTPQSIGLQQSDSAFDVLRNSFFALGESLERTTGALTKATMASIATATVNNNNSNNTATSTSLSDDARTHPRIRNLLQTAAFAPPASLPGLHQRITSLTTSAPPAFFEPAPLRIPAAAGAAAASPVNPLGERPTPLQPPIHSPSLPMGGTSPSSASAIAAVQGVSVKQQQQQQQQQVPPRSSPIVATAAGPLVDSASL